MALNLKTMLIIIRVKWALRKAVHFLFINVLLALGLMFVLHMVDVHLFETPNPTNPFLLPFDHFIWIFLMCVYICLPIYIFYRLLKYSINY